MGVEGIGVVEQWTSISGWEALPHLSVNVTRHRMINNGGKTYIVAGRRQDSEYSDKVLLVDLEKGITEVETIRTGGYDHAAIMVPYGYLKECKGMQRLL